MTKYVAIVKIRGSPEPPIVIDAGEHPDATSAFLMLGRRWRKWFLQTNVESVVICPEATKETYLAIFQEPTRRMIH